MYDSIISDNIIRFKLYHNLGYFCCKYNSIQCLQYIITKDGITPQIAAKVVDDAIHGNKAHFAFDADKWHMSASQYV